MKSTDPVVGPHAEQTFFADPAIDRLVGMVFALTAEVHVLRDRLALLEDALRSAGRSIRPLSTSRCPKARSRRGSPSIALRWCATCSEGLPGRLASKS